MDPGTLVADRFLIVRLAGTGGMGAIYRAEDRLTGEAVAIKVMQVDGGGADRFLREARLLADLAAPGIVKYVAHGMTPAGQAYLAMEWLDGEDLSQRLARTGLTSEESVLLATKIAEALAPAHARGIIHRDLKPPNVFLPGGAIDRMKLIDFGIARSVVAAQRVTRTGSTIGTPAYMAPEQARAQPDVDARADVYSLGCVLYECLAGRPPFQGEELVGVLTRVLFEEAPSLSDLAPHLPPRLIELVERMLSKDPSRRPRDAGQAALDLAALGPLENSRRAPRSLNKAAITGSEQRVVSVIMIAAPEEESTAVTITPDEASSLALEIRAIAAPFGAHAERLADGSVVATLTSASDANDQAVRAARCALALHERLPDRPIALCTGRGEVAGTIAIGEVAERAVALARGKTGTIHVDETTAGLLDSRFDITATRELSGVRDESKGTRTLLGKATPCVGREREMATLFATLDEAISDSVARAVVVTAPSGIGKSRLRAELVRKLAEREPEVVILSASADPMNAGSPFGLVADALASSLGAPAHATGTDARLVALKERVARHVPRTERARVAAFLGELMSLPQSDASDAALRAARQDRTLMGDQMRRAWEDFLSAECDAHPLLLMIDDLQWGDLSSVKLIDAALRNLAGKPLVVIAFGRPQIHDLFGLPWAERGVQEIRLGEISKKASERLVKSVLPDASEKTLDRIVTLAAGNAFFLEELIRAVAEGKGDALPGTVLAIVQSRLEALPTEARRVLRAASVFGQTFWKGGVLALTSGGGNTNATEEWLAHLVETELLTKVQNTRVSKEQEYAFRHALVQEAAYATLTPSDRALGHRIAAVWIEGSLEGAWVAIAEHYARGDRPSKALGAWVRAARQALEGNDFGAALAHAERGLSSGATGDARGTLLLLQAEARWWRGEFPASARDAKEAVSLLEEGSPQRFVALGLLAVSAGTAADEASFEEAARALREAVPTAESLGPLVVALAHVAARLLYLGRYADLERTLDAIDRFVADAPWEDAPYAGWIFDARSTRAMAKGDMATCLRLMERAAHAFEAAGDLRNACRERGHVGYAYQELGVFEAAEQALTATIENARRLGLAHVAAVSKHNLGKVVQHLGRLEEAERIEREAIHELTLQNDDRLARAAENYLAGILLDLGNLDAAEAAARSTIHTVRDPMQALALATLSRVLLACGRPEDALVQAESSFEILSSIGKLEEGEAEVRLAHIDALIANGRDASAEIEIAKAHVLALADRISDDAWRQSFLAKIPLVTKILALAEPAPDAVDSTRQD